jgi:hypothetical protein
MFGGLLRSQVKCHNCKNPSNAYDPFLDLSLEVTKASTMEKAFKEFTHSELLCGQNEYRCGNCKRMSNASKQFMIETAPHLLTVQFKRFSFLQRRGGKIGKHIQFPAVFNMAPFTSRPHEKCTYTLYAIVVHQGSSTRCGHYYAFVKASNGTWAICDDSYVRIVSEQQVLKQNAYICFYERVEKPSVPKKQKEATVKSAVDEANKSKITSNKDEEADMDESAAKSAVDLANDKLKRILSGDLSEDEKEHDKDAAKANDKKRKLGEIVGSDDKSKSKVSKGDECADASTSSMNSEKNNDDQKSQADNESDISSGAGRNSDKKSKGNSDGMSTTPPKPKASSASNRGDYSDGFESPVKTANTTPKLPVLPAFQNTAKDSTHRKSTKESDANSKIEGAASSCKTNSESSKSAPSPKSVPRTASAASGDSFASAHSQKLTSKKNRLPKQLSTDSVTTKTSVRSYVSCVSSNGSLQMRSGFKPSMVMFQKAGYHRHKAVCAAFSNMQIRKAYTKRQKMLVKRRCKERLSRQSSKQSSTEGATDSQSKDIQKEVPAEHVQSLHEKNQNNILQNDSVSKIPDNALDSFDPRKVIEQRQAGFLGEERIGQAKSIKCQFGTAHVESWQDAAPLSKSLVFTQSQRELQLAVQTRDKADKDYDAGKPKHKPRKGPVGVLLGKSAFDNVMQGKKSRRPILCKKNKKSNWKNKWNYQPGIAA